MANERELKDLFDATAYDNAGEKLGSIKEIFVDDNTSQPTFVEVGHGLFGLSSSLVPLRGAALEGDDLKLAFSKDRIKDAPDQDADRNLTGEQQEELYRHYGVQEAPEVKGFRTKAPQQDKTGAAAGADVGAAAGAGAGYAAHEKKVDEKKAAEFKGPEVDEHKHAAEQKETVKEVPKAAPKAAATGDDALIRSEERLNVDKERVASGEVRLHKYVVEDTETVEVPVEREEVRIERTPISEEEAANFTGKIGEEEAAVILHEERINVSKDTVPVEKISLGTETVKDTETVSETVRKEQFDTKGLDADKK